VIAIPITIMVLELRTPHGTTWAALREDLPVLLAYVLGFVNIGIYWNNHHMLAAISRVSGVALWAGRMRSSGRRATASSGRSAAKYRQPPRAAPGDRCALAESDRFARTAIQRCRWCEYPTGTDAHTKETSMASTARPGVRRILLAMAGAIIANALVAGTAGASVLAHTKTATSPRSVAPGFLLDRGRYTSFEAPDPTVHIIPFDINDRGQITGEYVRGDGTKSTSESGLYRDPRGRITTFDVPGAKGTEAVKLNDRGEVAGNYSDNTPIVNDPAARVHGYLLDLDGSRVTRIDAPGAVLTAAFGVNNRRQVVGYFTGPAGVPHAYLWERGRFATIDVPGAQVTQPVDINDLARSWASTSTARARSTATSGRRAG
jgi:probable HAF family extracellular repeat protein